MDSSANSPAAPAISFVPPAASIAAYEQTKAAIAEAAKGELTHINVDLSLAVRIMLTAAGNTVRYRDALAKLGIDAATKLEQQAHALSYATALHAWTMNVREPIADLAEELVNVRRVLTTELELCELRGVIAKGAVTPEGTTSYLALARDVHAIGSAFLANWERVGPEVGGKIDHMHAALAKADQLLATLARSEEVQEEQQGAALMRSSAWPLALATYRELERGIACLRFTGTPPKWVGAPRLRQAFAQRFHVPGVSFSSNAEVFQVDPSATRSMKYPYVTVMRSCLRPRASVS